MDSIIDQAKRKVGAWAESHKHVVLYDEESSTFLDVASGKRIRPSWRDLKDFEEKIHPETQDHYLVLLFENGTQIALVDPGGSRSLHRWRTPARCGIFRRWYALKTFSL